MFVWCAYCQKFQGEKEPHEDLGTTHGICRTCLKNRASARDLEWATEVHSLLARVRNSAVASCPLELETFLREACRLHLHSTEILLGILQPALVEVGVLFEQGRIAAAQEHRLSSFCQEVFRHLHPELATGSRAALGQEPFVCITDLPGNRHRLGPLFVAALLRDNSIPVHLLPPWVHPDEFLEVTSHPACAVVGISISMARQMPELSRCLALLGAPFLRKPVVIGGRATVGQRELFKGEGIHMDPWENDERVLLFHTLLGLHGSG